MVYEWTLQSLIQSSNLTIVNQTLSKSHSDLYNSRPCKNHEAQGVGSQLLHLEASLPLRASVVCPLHLVEHRGDQLLGIFGLGVSEMRMILVLLVLLSPPNYRHSIGSISVHRKQVIACQFMNICFSISKEVLITNQKTVR